MGLIGGHAFRQTLVDRCYIDTLAEGDEFGSDRAAQSYTEGTDSNKCRVEQHKAIEVMADSKIELSSATAWMDRDAVVDTGDRLRLTRRNSRTLTTPETYTILTKADTGFALKCELKQCKGSTAL